MERILSCILIICICLGSITGCNGNNDIDIKEETARNSILDEFILLSEIPRESGHVDEISSYLRTWAKKQGFKAVRDQYYNVIIDKPAAKGYESVPLTILQCHMDMTVEIGEGVVFDPANDTVKIINNDGKLNADGTSLGADNGIGIATALYILKHAVNHGPIRVIITADEESTMRGAEKLNPKYLSGKYLINLDWQNDKSICIGSAGSTEYDMKRNLTWTEPKNEIAFQLSVNGLQGGDSIKDINKGRANAIKILGETLAQAQGAGILFELAAFNGGVSKDTIPADASAHIIINESDLKKLNKVYEDALDSFDDIYGALETNYSFTLTEAPMPEKVVSFDDNSSIISFIYGIVNGVQSISNNDSNLIGSSSNIGRISTRSGDFLCEVYTRSLAPEFQYEISNAHEAISNMCNLEYSTKEVIPVWVANPDSTLVLIITEIYKDLYGKNLDIKSVDYPLESGWLAQKNPNIEIISLGALIKHADTPEETLTIKSISKPALIIMEFLQHIK